MNIKCTLLGILCMAALFALGATLYSATANAGDYYCCEYEPVPGPQGEPGLDGQDGADGVDGTNGRDGTDAFIDADDYQSGSALGIAFAQQHLDKQTGRLQGGVGVGYFGGVSAASVSLGKRFTEGVHKPLFSVTVGHTSTGDTGAGAGLNWEF